MTRLQRQMIAASELDAYLADGWRVVFHFPQPLRGTEWLMEKVS